MKHPFMGSEPLGLPLCMRSVDYSLLPVGAMAGRTLPGGRTYTQAVGANQIEEVFVTSWASGTMARISAVANTPKVGMAPNGKRGLRLRASWKNYLRLSNDFRWTLGGTPVIGTDVAVSPDGNTNADTIQDDDPAGYELVTATLDAIPSDTERYQLSGYVKDTSAETHALAINWSLTGGTPIARSERFNSNDGTLTGTGNSPAIAFGNWYNWRGYIDGNGTNTGVSLGLYPSATTIPLPGADTVAGQGVKTVYEFSVTRGKLWREPQPTGASGATCADCALTAPASWYVRGGRVRLRIKWSPTGAPTDYNTSFRLFDHGGETTYCEFSATDQKLRIVVAGGAAEVCAVPLWWPVASLLTTTHPMVEFDIEFGGNVASRIRYRYSTDGGVTWTLPFDPMGGTAGVAQGNVSVSGNVGIMTGASSGTVADGWLHEEELISYAPAWSLQALPTDVASVKAFFRADSSYTLVGSGVSRWDSLCATANLQMAQGVTASQPTRVLGTGPNGTDLVSFDGGDILVSNLTRPNYFGNTDGEILCGARIRAATLGGAGAYFNFHGIVADSSGGLGLHYRTSNVLDGGNYDGNADTAQDTYTLNSWMSLRWQHTGGNVGLSKNGAALTQTASGTTTVSAALTFGAGAVGYLTGDLTDVIVCDAALTAPQLAIIRSYLTARGLP